MPFFRPTILGLLFLPMLIFSSERVAAQEGATLSGRALDGFDGSPISLATVVVTDATSGDTLSGALAGEDGRFLIQGLAPGRYTIHISFPGFQSAEAGLFVSALNLVYDVGDISLVPVISLEELTVRAEEVRAAGVNTQVFRIGEGAAQSTGSVLDALRNLPGITVDQEGRVSLRGSDRVAILIDGRQSSLTGFGSQRGLDNVPVVNIEAIEIIHNPSARFDAAGMAGIINLIYKQERDEGLSADLGLSVGMASSPNKGPIYQLTSEAIRRTRRSLPA